MAKRRARPPASPEPAPCSPRDPAFVEWVKARLDAGDRVSALAAIEDALRWLGLTRDTLPTVRLVLGQMRAGTQPFDTDRWRALNEFEPLEELDDAIPHLWMSLNRIFYAVGSRQTHVVALVGHNKRVKGGRESGKNRAEKKQKEYAVEQKLADRFWAVDDSLPATEVARRIARRQTPGIGADPEKLETEANRIRRHLKNRRPRMTKNKPKTACR